MSELEPNPIRKIGFDLLALIDMEDALNELRYLWFGEEGRAKGKDIPFERYSPILFEIMQPRPAALGVLNDLVAEGCSLHFFTDIDDPEVGEQAEKWLQQWSGIRGLVLHQIRTQQSPVQLDCQAYIMSEGHTYEFPEGRPRIETHPAGGEFDTKVLDKARHYSVAKKR